MKSMMIKFMTLLILASTVIPVVATATSESRVNTDSVSNEILLSQNGQRQSNRTRIHLQPVLSQSLEMQENINEKYPPFSQVQYQERGKFTWAVKLIRKAWNKLPKNVRNFINRYTNLSGFLNFIEHYTGKLEDGIYNACKKVGMPNWMANIVTKTIMLVVF